jgi:hypothetical protein
VRITAFPPRAFASFTNFDVDQEFPNNTIISALLAVDVAMTPRIRHFLLGAPTE